MPASPATICPTKPARSSMARRMIDTVADTIAQGRIFPARNLAPRSADPMVGSPPLSRS